MTPLSFPRSFKSHPAPRKVEHVEKTWPFWLKATLATAAGVAVGIFLKSRYSVPVSPHYRVDPDLCQPGSPILSKGNTCNPLSPDCTFNPKDRIISYGTVYDNRNDVARNHYTDLVNELDRSYAKTWGLQHMVVSDLKKLVDKPCTDPLTLEKVECEPTYYKIYPFVQACEKYDQDSRQYGNKERWVIVKDTDMPALRPDISPYDLIDKVRVDREGNPVDTSIIMSTDSHPWAKSYVDLKNINPSKFNPNGGFIAGRIDKRSCPIYRKWWEARDAIPYWYDQTKCRSLGVCSSQAHGLHEQQAAGVVVDGHPCMQDLFTVMPVRDTGSKTRSDIVINSVYGHDQYCFKRCDEKGCGYAYFFDDTEKNPDVIYRNGDAFPQPNAFPIWGKIAHKKENGNCPSESEWSEVPIEQVRLRMIKEMCADSSQKELCNSHLFTHPTDKFVTTNLWMGLGNQLFQAAAAYAHALDIGGMAIFPNRKVDHVGTSPVLDRLNRGYAPINNMVEENWNIVTLPDDSVRLQGCFQSYKYFDHRRKEILELFKPSDEIRSHLETKYLDLLKKDTVAIHVRRGDYLTFKIRPWEDLQLYNLSEDPTYYDHALDQFDRENQHFVIFSDDIAFAKNMPAFKGLKHVTFIEGQKAHEDFYLMSMCKNHIIANSTFSWWAAYLSQNVNVVCPVKWFGPGANIGVELTGNYKRTPDFIPMPHWKVVE